jgi:hypothetical protein
VHVNLNLEREIRKASPWRELSLLLGGAGDLSWVSEGEGLDVREARLGAWRGLEKQDRGEADSRALWGGATGCWRVYSVFMLRSFIPNIEVFYVNSDSRYYRVACVFLPRTLASLGRQGRYGRPSMIPSKLIFR